MLLLSCDKQEREIKREIKREEQAREVKESKMSSDSSEASKATKVYKLRSRRHFATWKQKTLANASARGFEQY